MSGHSHWSTIRRKKEANDAKRGAVFTKVAREIVIAVREGGGSGDPDTNIRLRMMLDKARTMGMPKDNVERAIRRGTGEDKDGTEIIEIMYEGYGPGGVAVMIDVVTDNRNRAVSSVRHALTRQGGNMGDPGSVAWQFERKGVISVPASIDFDQLFEAALNAGAEDLFQGNEGDAHEVYTEPTELHAVSDALKSTGIPVEQLELVMKPKNEMSVSVKEAVQVLKLVDFLEELDDVRRVYSNLEVTDEAVTAFEATL